MSTVFFFYNKCIYFQQKKILINFLNIYFFLKISDTEYRKLLGGSCEYEYEEYPDQDNYGSNNPQDTNTTSIGSTKEKTSLGSKTYSTTEIESTEKNIQNSHTTDMTTAESSKHYLR